MVKTRRMRSSRGTRKMRSYDLTLKPDQCTYHGLFEWHNKMFEELGWMVFAQKRGRMDKIMVYKNSLQHLKKCIENKIASVHEKDRKEDLKLLWKNVCILIDHVNKDF